MWVNLLSRQIAWLWSTGRGLMGGRVWVVVVLTALGAGSCGLGQSGDGSISDESHNGGVRSTSVQQNRPSHIDSGGSEANLADLGVVDGLLGAVDLPNSGVRTGAQVMVDDGFSMLAGESVVVVLNHASEVGGEALLSHMARASTSQDGEQFDLVAAYGPEHGVGVDGAAGEPIGDSIDDETAIPTFSLYRADGAGQRVLPPGIDTVVFDLQDVGVRVYTYVSTLGDAMQMAAQSGARFVVLDRPNPLGGEHVSGFVRAGGFESFVGRYPTPFVHGMTMGEMAMAIKGEHWLGGLEDLEVVVVPMQGWRREYLWADTGLPWVAPSPGLPSIQAANAYPSTVLFEATQLSVGRGTSEPFSLVGAPWVNPVQAVDELANRGLAGVKFEPVSFVPVSEPSAPEVPFQDQMVHGVRVIVDPAEFSAMVTAVHLIDVLNTQAEDAGAGQLINRPKFFDLLAGSDQLRRSIEQGLTPSDIIAGWEADVVGFQMVRSQYLIYPASRQEHVDVDMSE